MGMRLHWEIPNDLAGRWQMWQWEGRVEETEGSCLPETLGPKECQSSERFPEKVNPDVTSQVKKTTCVETISSTSSGTSTTH